MFNAKRYMHMNDAYFTPDQVMFPYEAKKIFDRIVHELHYLNIETPHHFALYLDHLDRIFEYRFLQSKSYSFPVTCVEIEYMFDTLGFLWIHHNSPQYMIYLLDKLVAWLDGERKSSQNVWQSITMEKPTEQDVVAEKVKSLFDCYI